MRIKLLTQRIFTQILILHPNPYVIMFILLSWMEVLPTCWDENDENIILSKPIDVLRAMYEMDDAINNVVSIYITDYMGFNLDVDSSGTLRFPSSNFVNVDIMYEVAGVRMIII
jgi:hypothetical protein